MLERLTQLWMGDDRQPIYSKISEDYARRFSLDSVAQEEQRLLERIQKLRRSTIYLSCFCGLLLLALVGQVAFNTKDSWAARKPVPQMPERMVRFEKSDLYSAISTTESDLAWSALLPAGKGFVSIKDSGKYDLPPGMTIGKQPHELYNVAAFHQIHCLTSIRDYLSHLKFAVDQNQTEQLQHLFPESHQDRIAGCFDYLRQALMCAGDMTLEWPSEQIGGHDQIVDGWGISHQCVDWDAVLHYTEANGPSSPPK